VWDLQTPESMKALASRLAALVSPVDFIALYGELGAGKTTFAQGLLPALGVTEAVTSPTYGLVHSYAAGARKVNHCDFYRLSPGEEEETGFHEICANSAVVAEWPEAIQAVLPANRLEVRIEGDGDARRVSLAGFGAWEKKLKRFREIEAFLAKHGLGDARCTAIRGDASARLFSRLAYAGADEACVGADAARTGGISPHPVLLPMGEGQDEGSEPRSEPRTTSGARAAKTVMLMDWPPQPDGPPIRDGRPYCEIAHLAREGRSFIAISRWLRGKAGISAPAILASDLNAGLFLAEDLGDAVFGQLIAEGADIEPLYALAVDALLSIRASQPPQALPLPGGASYRVPDYDREALEVELDLLLQWYFKLRTGEAASPELAASFFAAWSPFLDWLETQPKDLVLRDYHSPNLLLCESRGGLRRLGAIDFQDAVWGHPAYDLVSLLQDARLEVPEEAERALFERYCSGAAKADAGFSRDDFAKAYAILGAQRNTKIAGIFARLSMRDGKHGYLAHLPRILRYLFRNLAHPGLKSLDAWYEVHLRPLETVPQQQQGALR
jgi:tRNA threonylcarbamoyl adenosine modification protein YjeE